MELSLTRRSLFCLLLISSFCVTLAWAQTPPAPSRPNAAPVAPAPNAAPAMPPTPVQQSQPAAETTSQPPAQAQKVTPRTLELTDFQQFVAQSLGYALPIYGASLFANAPTTFAPVDRIPVTANYVIGPGDELLIRLWGQVDLDVHARVDRNGTVFIPRVGQLNVSGLRFEQLQGFLTSQIGRIYQNFDLTVTMGDLRSIDIFVVGQASQPGRYTVSSLSTLTNAIFVSGGPASSGSMRRIQLKRGTKLVTEFDLYDLLIKGDKTHDVLLQPEDVIFFPPVGPQVAVGGQVNTPAVYELKGETTLSDLFTLAGGLTNTAYGGKVFVEEILNRNSRRVEEVPLDSPGLAHHLKDGDLVNVVPLSPKFENAITLRGNVASPGRYPWREGMRISDLIPSRDFLVTRDYWKA